MLCSTEPLMLLLVTDADPVRFAKLTGPSSKPSLVPLVPLMTTLVIAKP